MSILQPDPEHLRRLAQLRMPFGKHKGERMCQLPDAYLLWFERKGWPPGQLGKDMAEMLDIHRAGCIALLRRCEFD